MAARSTRRKIKDSVGKARNHIQTAVGDLRIAMDYGEERSKECAILIPEIITMLLEMDKLIEEAELKL